MPPGKYATPVRPSHPCTRHDSACPPAVIPQRPLTQRFLRRVAVIAVLTLAGWAAGILMQASHLPDQTRILAGIAGAAGIFLIGFLLTGRTGRQKGRR